MISIDFATVRLAILYVYMKKHSLDFSKQVLYPIRNRSSKLKEIFQISLHPTQKIVKTCLPRDYFREVIIHYLLQTFCKTQPMNKLTITNLQKISVGSEYIPPLVVLYCHTHVGRDPLQHKYQTCKKFGMHLKILLNHGITNHKGRRKDFVRYIPTKSFQPSPSLQINVASNLFALYHCCRKVRDLNSQH